MSAERFGVAASLRVCWSLAVGRGRRLLALSRFPSAVEEEAAAAAAGGGRRCDDRRTTALTSVGPVSAPSRANMAAKKILQ